MIPAARLPRPMSWREIRVRLWLLAAIIIPVAASAAPSGLSVSHPWFRYLLPQIPAGGFMALKNDTAQPIVLTGARSPSCGMAMLHKSVSNSGMDRMIHVKSITIPAHGTFAFAPGAYHVMCMQPKMKVGEMVPVTLMFRKHPPMTIQFSVEGPDGSSPSK